LEGLLRGELSAAERRVVVRHLLTGCPQCVQITGRFWALGETTPRRRGRRRRRPSRVLPGSKIGG
jgi:hypothetical protein